MVIPVVIFIGCLSVGVIFSARWLPDLDEGPVGGIAFFVTCGLLGLALALVGLHLYSIVETVDQIGEGVKVFGKSEVVTSGLLDMSWEAGSVLALAMLVYLLAPPPSEPVVEHSAA